MPNLRCLDSRGLPDGAHISASTRSHTPSLDQRLKVCAAIHHGPCSAGRLRHLAPLSCRHRIAPTVRRNSRGGTWRAGAAPTKFVKHPPLRVRHHHSHPAQRHHNARPQLIRYFDGLYSGDTEILGQIFHERSRLHVILDGALVEIEKDAYMRLVRGRASPESLGSDRDDRIVGIHQTTSDTALVMVALLLAEKSYTDQLSLIKDEGRWQIISEVYHLNQRAA